MKLHFQGISVRFSLIMWFHDVFVCTGHILPGREHHQKIISTLIKKLAEMYVSAYDLPSNSHEYLRTFTPHITICFAIWMCFSAINY
jgi:hypothetical protein